MVPYDGLKSARVNSIDLTDDTDVLVLVLVFWYDHVWRGMVLFITHQNVRDEWAFTRKERYGHLNGFSVPVLRVFPFESLFLNFFLQLVQESIFCAHAEVAHGKEAHFFKDKFTWKFQLYWRLTQEILQCQWWNLHDISDVQTVNPFTLVQIAKNVFHIWITTIVKIRFWPVWCIGTSFFSIFLSNTWRIHISFPGGRYVASTIFA